MAKNLDICLYPDPVLREQCLEVDRFDSELAAFLDDMALTMYRANGVGLAAPQVGVTRRVTVVDCSDEGNEIIELINPLIIAAEGKVSSEEGCLSIPDYRAAVSRNEWIKVEALDRTGKPFQLEAEGLLSFCIQHEIDHLNGVLFVDHMSRLKQQLFKKKYQKRQRLEQE